MKITKVKSWTEHIKLTRPYTIAFKTIDSVENIFVRLDAEGGYFGLGVASPEVAVTGESFDDCRKALEKNLESLLIGKDIRQTKAICRELKNKMCSTPGAMAAVDIALHDLMTKFLDMPLVDFLGRVHQSMPTSITIGIKSIEDSLEEAQEYLDRGFSVIKLKIGKSLEEDLEILYKLREKVGKGITIRVDANQGYSVENLLEFVDRIKSIDIEFIEQPLKYNNIKGMFSLPESIRKQIAADESIHNEFDAFQLAQTPQPFGIYNIKLMKCGGVFPAMQMAEMANLAGIDLMWGCNDESIVSISAALHAALASPATKYLDLDGSFDLARDLVEGGFVLKDGCLSVNNIPGLGLILK